MNKLEKNYITFYPLTDDSWWFRLIPITLCYRIVALKQKGIRYILENCYSLARAAQTKNKKTLMIDSFDLLWFATIQVSDL